MTNHKVFQIGFSKCGTTSLSAFFNQNNIPSISWKKQQDSIFYENLKNNKDPFLGLEEYKVYTDSEFIRTEFSLLEMMYPNAKFIYNIRPLNDWLKSRLSGKYAGGNIKVLSLNNKTYRQYYQIKSDEEFINLCKYEWLYHKSRIEKYFVGDKAKKLLTINITKNPSEEIRDFLPEFKFTNLLFPYKNKS